MVSNKWPMIALKEIVIAHYGKALKKELRDETGYIDVFGSSGKVGCHSCGIVDYPTLIVGRKGSVGEVIWAPKGGWIIDTAFYIELKSDSVDLRYLFYALKKANLAQRTITTSIPGLNRDDFYATEIPLPPLAEQKRIAAILDKADAIRRKRQQAIQLADEFLRAVFLDMFGDPVTNPKGFDKASITTLAEVITGFAFKSKDYVSDSPDAVRLCRGANTLTGYFDWTDTAFWPKDKIAGTESYLIKGGDVILAMDRPWISSGLKVCIFPDKERDTYLVQRVARLRPISPLYTDYIYSCIQSNAFEKHCCPTETTVPHISPVELKNFQVMIPDEPMVMKYHELASRVRAFISNIKLSKELNENGFNALSQKAFRGEL